MNLYDPAEIQYVYVYMLEKGTVHIHTHIIRLYTIIWLVVLTILKNTSQWEGLSHTYIYIMQNKKMFETTNQPLTIII